MHRRSSRSFAILLARSTQGFESVALDIIFTPGYVCRAGRAEHEECFREREKLLSNLADNVTQAVQQAGPLFDSRVGLERTAARIRQRELALVAIRTAVRLNPLTTYTC